MEHEGFYIFGAVLLLFALVLFVGVGITGNAVVSTGSFSCRDSDGGQKPLEKGIVMGLDKKTNKIESYVDQCSDKSYLKEGYCNKKFLSIKTYKCTKGCTRGVCVR